MRCITIYVLPFRWKAQYTWGTGMDVLAAIYCIAAASDMCWYGAIFHADAGREKEDIGEAWAKAFEDLDSCEGEIDAYLGRFNAICAVHLARCSARGSGTRRDVVDVVIVGRLGMVLRPRSLHFALSLPTTFHSSHTSISSWTQGTMRVGGAVDWQKRSGLWPSSASRVLLQDPVFSGTAICGRVTLYINFSSQSSL